MLKDQVKKVPPGLGDRTMWSSSCVWGLRSLLNTNGILTFQCFCWVMDLWYKCEVLLLLNDVGCCCLCLIDRDNNTLHHFVKSLDSVFGCFVELWWILMALVVWFLWSETLSGTCWFHLCTPLCSCRMGISSGRLYQFSGHLYLDLLDAWGKTWWCWYL